MNSSTVSITAADTPDTCTTGSLPLCLPGWRCPAASVTPFEQQQLHLNPSLPSFKAENAFGVLTCIEHAATLGRRPGTC